MVSPESKPREPRATIFIHIPKTAGATLFHVIMMRQYPKESIYNSKLLNPENLREFLDLPESKRHAISLLHGHMQFGLHDYLATPSTYVTVLRDPVERVVSFYYYQLSRPHTPLTQEILKRELDLQAFVESGLGAMHTDNGQTRLVAGVAEKPYGAVTKEDLDSAVHNLDHHFAVVGLTEKFDESVLLMKSRLGWNKQIMYHRVHVSRSRAQRAELSDATISAIKERNHLDQLLYEHGRRLFEAAVAEEGAGFALRAKRYKAGNRLYEKIHPRLRSARQKLSQRRSS